jgi:hypothetical protein
VIGRLLADENFDGRVLRALIRQEAGLDVVRAQDVGLGSADDPAVLEWAARDDRVVLTHDVKTMTRYAYARVAAGLAMPGVIEVGRTLPVGDAVEELLLVIGACDPPDLKDQVIYLPLR